MNESEANLRLLKNEGSYTGKFKFRSSGLSVNTSQYADIIFYQLLAPGDQAGTYSRGSKMHAGGTLRE